MAFLACLPSAWSDDRGDYHSLAYALSDPYSYEGSEFLQRSLFEGTIGRLAVTSGDPLIRKVAGQFNEKGIARNGVDIDEESKARGQALWQKGEEEYKRYRANPSAYEYTEKVPDHVDRVEGRDHIIYRDEQRFRGFTYYKPNRTLADWQAIERRKMVGEAETLRLESWLSIIPDLPRKFAGPLATTPMVDLYLEKGRYDDSPAIPPMNRLRGRYVARNSFDADLTNVTLLVDFLHYSTIPLPTARQFYFIPRWKKGETIELSRDFRTDGMGVDAIYSVLPGIQSGKRSDELVGLMGVVRLQAVIWADEAMQPITTFDLPDRVKAVGDQLLQEIGYAGSSPAGRAIRPYFTRLPSAPTTSRRMSTLEILTTSLLSFAPKGSELESKAREFTRPGTAKKAAEDLLKAKLFEACKEGTSYVGGLSAQKETLYIILTIRSRAEDGRVKAEIQTDQVKAPMTGILGRDKRSGVYALKLTLGKPSTPPRSDVEKYSSRFLTRYLPSGTLLLVEDKLVGRTGANDLVELKPNK
jgi:hypothetical protein